MWDFGRCHEEVSLFEGDLLLVQQSHTMALEDLINFVHIGVGMQCMLLSGFKCIEAYQESWRPKQSAFAHFFCIIEGMFCRSDGLGMFHRKEFQEE